MDNRFGGWLDDSAIWLEDLSSNHERGARGLHKLLWTNQSVHLFKVVLIADQFLNLALVRCFKDGDSIALDHHVTAGNERGG